MAAAEEFRHSSEQRTWPANIWSKLISRGVARPSPGDVTCLTIELLSAVAADALGFRVADRALFVVP